MNIKTRLNKLEQAIGINSEPKSVLLVFWPDENKQLEDWKLANDGKEPDFIIRIVPFER